MTTTIYTDPSDQVTKYHQPTAVPTAKVKAVGYAGIITTLVPLLVTALATFNINLGDSDSLTTALVALVGAVVTIYNAATAIILFLSGYFKKSDTANGAVKRVG
jgi:hypothetical protein